MAKIKEDIEKFYESLLRQQATSKGLNLEGQNLLKAIESGAQVFLVQALKILQPN